MDQTDLSLEEIVEGSLLWLQKRWHQLDLVINDKRLRLSVVFELPPGDDFAIQNGGLVVRLINTTIIRSCLQNAPETSVLCALKTNRNKDMFYSPADQPNQWQHLGSVILSKSDNEADC